MPRRRGQREKRTGIVFIPLKVWGDPSARTAYTIELFPIHGPQPQHPAESVLVYARDPEEAFLIAQARALPLNLEPRRREASQLN